MAIITLTSDFGESDHYVGALKGAILSKNPNQILVDISHQIRHFDLAHGAFVIKASFRSFPKGTIHIVAVDTIGNQETEYLAVQLEGHIFLIADHGMLSLISDELPEQVIALSGTEKHSAFPALEILAPAAIEIANGKAPGQLGEDREDYNKMMGRSTRVNKNSIMGHVVRVDHYGNLITNITKEQFCNFSKEKAFRVLIGREQFRRIHESIADTGSGDCFVIFNSLGLLEVGINKGNASELLGLHFDSPIRVEFE